MTTTGSIDVNLTPYGNTVNNSAQLAADVTAGVATQGSLIGTVMGIIIALTFLIGLIVLVFSFLFLIFRKINELRGAVPSIE